MGLTSGCAARPGARSQGRIASCAAPPRAVQHPGTRTLHSACRAGMAPTPAADRVDCWPPLSRPSGAQTVAARRVCRVRFRFVRIIAPCPGAPPPVRMAFAAGRVRISLWVMSETGAIRTPDQRVRVFVSSTLTELAAERRAVRDAVTRLRLVPVMFELGARPHPARKLYRAYLAQSQVFVGVYWQSYGWIAPGTPDTPAAAGTAGHPARTSPAPAAAGLPRPAPPGAQPPARSASS